MFLYMTLRSTSAKCFWAFISEFRVESITCRNKGTSNYCFILFISSWWDLRHYGSRRRCLLILVLKDELPRRQQSMEFTQSWSPLLTLGQPSHSDVVISLAVSRKAAKTSRIFLSVFTEHRHEFSYSLNFNIRSVGFMRFLKTMHLELYPLKDLRDHYSTNRSYEAIHYSRISLAVEHGRRLVHHFINT